MPEPIVYVDVSEVREGKLEELRQAMTELAAFVEANEPQLTAYSFYLDEAASRMTVFALHPDPASMEIHFETAGPRFAGFAELLRLLRIDIYGQPGENVLRRLRAKATMLGSGTVATHELHAGFIRFGRP
jgi:hypothetical protein